MRFSIVVPVYNSQKYLKKCLDSVVSQSFRDYEILLVDDGSTDKSGIICDDYVAKYQNIRKITHKVNQGQVASRTDGIKAAVGEYIVFADSDDTLELNALEVLNKKIEQYHPDGIMYEITRMTAHGIIKIHSGKSFDDYILCDKASLYRVILSNPSYYSMCKKAFKRNLFSTTGLDKLYKMRIGEDFFQTMDIIANSSSVLFISDDLYNYRNNSSSTIHRERAAKNYKTDFSSALFVVDLIKNSQLFSEKELTEQLTLSLHGIADRLEEISNLKTGYKRKEELFEQIKNAPYFVDYILDLGTADLVGLKKKLYGLFLMSRYKKLICIEKIVFFPKRIKHLISVIL